MDRQPLRLLVVGGVFLYLIATQAQAEHRHPCQRECRGGEGGKGEEEELKPMTCRYRWLVENYAVLSRACYQCPSNSSDCWRPQCVSADGVHRSIRTINRQVPGPDIQVCEGDTIEVEVINQMMMSEALTIHWHGLRQRRSQHMDGVSMLTQCPIPTFSSFTYRFLAEDPGTHFYHSHSGMFRGEGLFGPLIIRQSASRDPHRKLYDLDLSEHVITLNDWTHKPIVEVYSQFFHAGGSQTPSNILINGRGVYPILDDSITDQDGSTPLARFDVKSDVRYRFRVINAGALRCPIEFSIDHHSLLLIASDGQPLKPLSVASVMIFSGERYDFIVETKKQLAGKHWIRARGQDQCASDGGIQQFAILNYVDRHVTQDDRYPDESTAYQAPVAAEGLHFNRWFLEENSNDPDEHAQIMNMTSLLPDDVSLRKEPDQRIMLDFSFRHRENLHFVDPDLYPVEGEGFRKAPSSPMVNNISNISPPSPLLFQYDDVSPELLCNITSMKEKKNCDEEFCECVHRVIAQEGDVVEIVAYNTNDQHGYTHPLHLHGYDFRVVAAERTERKITRELFLEWDKKGLIHRRLHGAPLKDTVPIPNGGYIILRFLADNPGMWFMHCHVAMHAEVGMALTLHVTSAEGHPPPPPPDFPRCGNWPNAPHSYDVSQHLNVRGVQNDVRSDDAASGKEKWMGPVLIGLVCVNVVGVMLGLFYCMKKHRVMKKLEEGYQPMRMRDAQTYSASDDECNNLLTH